MYLGSQTEYAAAGNNALIRGGDTNTMFFLAVAAPTIIGILVGGMSSRRGAVIGGLMGAGVTVAAAAYVIDDMRKNGIIGRLPF